MKGGRGDQCQEFAVEPNCGDEGALREKEVADLLSQTLEEEKQTDLKLTEVTQKAIMPEALAGDEEEGGGGQPGSRSGSRRKAA